MVIHFLAIASVIALFSLGSKAYTTREVLLLPRRQMSSDWWPLTGKNKQLKFPENFKQCLFILRPPPPPAQDIGVKT